MKKFIKLFAVMMLFVSKNQAATFKVINELGKPLPLVMVTESLISTTPADTTDGGYATAGVVQIVQPEITKFTDKNGAVTFPSRELTGEVKYRFRKVNFKDFDHIRKSIDSRDNIKVTLNLDTDANSLAEAKPANVWLGALDFGNHSTAKEDKILFQMQCGFCHQQGTSFTRQERSPEEWSEVIKRMIRYGSRLPTDLQKSLPQKLSEGFRKLRLNPQMLGESVPWQNDLSKLSITEWPIGDGMSQTHDLILGKNKKIYVGDNIQDRIYEVDTIKNEITIYKIPHRPGEKNGGLIAGRLKEFPRHDSTSNAHSLAESMVDGHIFITPSAQRRLVEFDPDKKVFKLHEMSEGFYPHTIRVDQQDNVWFTLALSNQVAKFDRKSNTFTYFNLPARSFKEKMVTKYIGFLFKLMSWGIPVSNLLKIDRESSGTPLAYGIDITPDGKVWFTRLHTKEIGSIDPQTGKITMVPTPFWGPRRLRTDAEGNVWVTSFGESKIARYSPSQNRFDMFDLPVNPKGSDTPYALNVDKKRNIVWVNGNQSDAIYGYQVKTNSWKIIPFSRKTTFTRDVEIADDGSIYTCNSNFPSWHIEDSQPTLIKVSGF